MKHHGKDDMTLSLLWHNKTDNTLRVASDSLLSDSYGNRWEHGTKIFRLYPSSHVIAYCGKSTAALHAVLQGMAVLNSSATLGAADGPECPQIEARAKALKNHLNEILPSLPAAWGDEAELLLCGWDHRENKFKAQRFRIGKAGIKDEPVDIEHLGRAAMGSGGDFARKEFQTTANDTDSMLRILRKAIADKTLPDVGGVPQMMIVGQGDCQPVAFECHLNGKDEYFLFGIPLCYKSTLSKVLFLNRHFKTTQYKKAAKVVRK